MQGRNDFRFDPTAPGVEELLAGMPGLDDLPDDIDWSDPTSFFKHINAGAPGGLPMPEMMEPAQVRRLCRDRSSAVLASYARLRGILERHEATIQKRWTKKTKQQRLQILLNAWPNMAPVHRPDFAAFRKESMTQRERGTKFRDHFFWPSINQEDLLKPKTLPLMLKSRARNHPCEFAASDGEAMHLGRVTKATVPIFLNCYVVTLNGVTSLDEYGKLIAWDDHPDAFDWMHTRRQFMPGEALDILEAQERLMKFLVNCCEQILHEIPPTELIGDQYPIQPEPALKLGVEPSGFDSLAVMAEEAPYRPPGSLDFGRIESLLAARTTAAEDQYVSLFPHFLVDPPTATTC